jgi:tryptophan synthase beta chain
MAVEERKKKEGHWNDYVIACIGGGSNAAGTFYHFCTSQVGIIAVEAAKRGR